MSTKYEEKFIAFIDILGFQSIVSKNNASYVNRIITEFYEIVSHPKKFIQRTIIHKSGDLADIKLEDVEISNFSDTIIISIKKTKNYSEHQLMRLYYILKTFQENTFIKGILIRGSIVIGEIYHKGQICYGPGLIQAYYLESKLANYPRIIIDESVLKINREFFYIDWVSERSTDGLTFFDLFWEIKFTCKSGGKDSDAFQIIKSQMIEKMKSFKLGLLKVLSRTTTTNPRIRQKINWITNRYLEVSEMMLNSGLITPNQLKSFKKLNFNVSKK